MSSKHTQWICAASLIALVATACSGEKSGTAAQPSGKEESAPPRLSQQGAVEITFLGTRSKENFMNEDGAGIMKKFPNVKLNYYLIAAKDDLSNAQMSLESAMTTGVPVDVVHIGIANVGRDLIDTKLAVNHDEYIKKYKTNLSHMNPQAIEAQKAMTGGPMYGLPVNRSAVKIYYNKDLFDKFGVAYPKDGPTWNETYEMAKRLTRNDGGVAYQGAIITYDHLITQNQVGSAIVDAKTNKSTFVTDAKWQKFTSNLVRFHQIPGNESRTTTLFTNDGKAAMWVTAGDLNSAWGAKMNWDMAKMPVFDDLPGVGGIVRGSLFSVTSLSKHKDEAYQIVEYLASEEHMMFMHRQGRLSVLNNTTKSIEAFGKELTWLNGKKVNFKAMFYDKPMPLYTATKYDGTATTELVKEMDKLAKGQTSDVNTALRLADEAASKAISAQAGK
ncbi:MAG: extracellular solute-binding protein family 1 [Paenibacillus sp.]|jgi:multiple sugar transport system substrate-binding protein|nr:extracellular solute-binding protein family 1 [Paenibacillus sp.]